MATLVSINISTRKGIPKEQLTEGTLQVDFGLVGDVHSGGGHRQLSLLAAESIQKIKERGLPNLRYGQFAENLTTEGIVLHELPVGTKLQVGQTLLEITQIGKECHSRCAIFHQAGDCVMPREGIFARVLQGGKIAVGDDVAIVNT